ncbi:hypothetical protein Poli38472_008151 [Pythium oligandrum]|uniref:non-specific serine/threonine protein kinase n=1 Tax=Pythium oligandrum TaxID=41045 RepID=A0A8K1CLZ7_PYTOL|nr:hypothetical protein Poli38472_008151 [Pythium oligandrum]|eukprot:TMW65509.1 hypothetical protein Poli38472_008151 [Pythium oligandrum]
MDVSSTSDNAQPEALDLRHAVTQNEYRVQKQISKGSYGDVFVAERISDGRLVCLKQMDLEFLSTGERNGCLEEVRLLQSLPHHPHIIRLYDAFWDVSIVAIKHRLVLSLEYAAAGDLDVFIQSQPRDVTQTLRIFAQVLTGVGFLHSRHILHRDLKSKNIFCFNDERVVVGDFGTCKPLASTVAMAKTLVGSPLYMSPELLDDEPYSFSTDVWSLGCVLYELLTSRTPFAAPSYPAVVLKITKAAYDPLPPSIPGDVQGLVAKMLQRDPHERPSIAEILDMEIVKQHCQDVRAVNAEPREDVESVSSEEEPPPEYQETEEAVDCIDPSRVAEESFEDCGQPSGEKDTAHFLLPPPAPVTTTKALTHAELVHDSSGLPLPPPPAPQSRKPNSTSSTAAVYPTDRARLASILSRERLQMHRQHKTQAASSDDTSRYLSCIPHLDADRVPSNAGTRVVKKKPTPRTASSPPQAQRIRPRASLPETNMMIVGTKVRAVVDGSKVSSRAPGQH